MLVGFPRQRKSAMGEENGNCCSGMSEGREKGERPILRGPTTITPVS